MVTCCFLWETISAQAEISARLAALPEQIFLKRCLRLHEESFSQTEISSPVSQTRLEISARSNELKNLM